MTITADELAQRSKWPDGTFDHDAALELIAARNTIDAQAAKVAEQQAVIDQRNGECDRLINELEALRAQTKPAESYPDDADLRFQIDWHDDERNDSLQLAMWLKELRRRREKPTAPVAVPDDVSSSELYRIANHVAGAKASLPDEWQPWADDIEDGLRNLLRLNTGSKPNEATIEAIKELESGGGQQSESADALFKELGIEGGSKQFVVKLPDLRQTVSGELYVWSDGVYNYQQDVIAAIRAAGGSVSDD